jgi:hypothetical protein
MSIGRQFGLHELPGTEEPAPQAKPRTVTAGFESQIRGYIDAIWLKIAELEGRIDDFEGWRTAIALALKDATGIDPRNSARPLLVSPSGPSTTGDLMAKGEAIGGSPNLADQSKPPPKPFLNNKPRGAKPWEAEGVSKATWYRRHKEATA